mmetsp:Transcript_20227/g.68833  ORF Transcript_20227/g.68833 Transcript_20227/m.68833 type:complete len:142 (+) Transcript_20227:158-583(+)
MLPAAARAWRRGVATAAPRDFLRLRGLVFDGFHGVLPEENVLGQKFVVDMAVGMDLRKAGLSDDLADTVSYAAVQDIAREEMQGETKQLIETVAENIAARTLREHPAALTVRVEIRKPHVAVRDVVDSLGIEIYRTRDDLE